MTAFLVMRDLMTGALTAVPLEGSNLARISANPEGDAWHIVVETHTHPPLVSRAIPTQEKAEAALRRIAGFYEQEVDVDEQIVGIDRSDRRE